MHPYAKPPKLAFLVRTLPFAAAAWIGLLALVGLLWSVREGHLGEHGVFESVAQLYERMIAGWREIPSPCRDGNMVNDFQRQQCSEFWSRQRSLTIWSLVPGSAVLIGWLLAWEWVRGSYQEWRSLVVANRPLGIGTGAELKTQPRSGVFTWLHDLQPVPLAWAPVSSPSQRRVEEVYIPSAWPKPRAGESWAVFEGGNRLGKRRLLAIPVMPHVAVKSSSGKF